MAMGQGTLVPDAGEVVLDQMMAEGRNKLLSGNLMVAVTTKTDVMVERATSVSKASVLKPGAVRRS